jgi:hypothetical protein
VVGVDLVLGVLMVELDAGLRGKLS